LEGESWGRAPPTTWQGAAKRISSCWRRKPSSVRARPGAAPGGVRYQFDTEVNIRLSLESLPMLERFEEEIGQPIDYRQCGYLMLLSQPEDLAVFQAQVSLQNRLGVDTEWLSGDEIRRRLPVMRLEDILAGTFHSKDGLVDPNGVVMGYIQAARRLGVRAETGC
jgi:sarcosine oxidase, subunit beta